MPALQLEQLEEAEPEYLPAGHVPHDAELVAPPVMDHVPALQFVQEAAPDDDQVPVEQVTQTAADVAASAFAYVPALHV